MTEDGWDEHARGWDENPSVRAYSEAAFASLLALEIDGRLQLEGARVLDFGCGTGPLTEKLSERAKAVVALDTSSAMIEILQAKVTTLGLDNVTAIAGPIEVALGEHSEAFAAPFDVVTCSSVCGFLEEYPTMVRTLSGLLRVGGAFVQWDWERQPKDPEPFGLTRSQIEEALEAADLRDVLVDVAFDVDCDGARMRPLLGFGLR